MGDFAQTTRCFSAADVAAYLLLGGEPPEPGFAPEPLIGALFSKLLGVDLPGPGTNYLKQETRFERAPALGEPVTARVTIIRIRPEKHLIDLTTECFGEDGSLIASGRALVSVRDIDTAVLIKPN